VRRLALAIAAMLVAGFAGAERTSGVFIFTAPDGSRRIVNVPASGPGTIAIPEGAADHRAALWPAVEEAALSHGLDPRLVDLVIRMESGYNPRAVSPKGARGVMQLMPATASMYGVANLFDPLQNIRAGVRYLKDLFQRFNSDVSLALAAYNAGPEAVEKHGGVPPYDETRSYVRAILMAYRGDTVRPPSSPRQAGGTDRRGRQVADRERSPLGRNRRSAPPRHPLKQSTVHS